jgi:hypothetical protein
MPRNPETQQFSRSPTLQRRHATYSSPTMKENLISVGLELEMTKISTAANMAFDQHNFGRRTDASICDNAGNPLPRHGPNVGIEIVTPILEASVELSPNGDADKFGFDKIRPVIKDLTACAASVNSSCGLHVHLGRPNGEKST